MLLRIIRISYQALQCNSPKKPYCVQGRRWTSKRVLFLSEYFLHCHSVLYCLAGWERIEHYDSLTKSPSFPTRRTSTGMPSPRWFQNTAFRSTFISSRRTECFLGLWGEEWVQFQVKYGFILQSNPAKPRWARLFLQSHPCWILMEQTCPRSLGTRQPGLSLLRLKEDASAELG